LTDGERKNHYRNCLLRANQLVVRDEFMRRKWQIIIFNLWRTKNDEWWNEI